jgi:preprotein translocase subunit SecD
MSYHTSDQPPQGRAMGPALIAIALVVLGCLLSFLAIRSADTRNTAAAGGTMSDPLRFAPVQSVTAGDCADATPDTLRSPDSASCVSLVPGDGFEVARLHAAKAVFDSDFGDGWVVQIAFGDEDAERFGDLTGRLAGRIPPANQLAIVLGERLLTSPSVDGRIDGGAVDISGDFSRQEAEDLAEQLRG